MPNRKIDKELVTIFGDEFLKYVLNSAGDDPIATRDLNDDQLQVVNFLRSFAGSALNDESSDDSFRRRMALAGLARYIPEQNGSVANLLRQGLGGQVPEIPRTDDAVLDHILQVARDTWSEYLLPHPKEVPATFWMSTPAGIYQHPTLPELATKMLHDPGLSSFFPSDSDDDRSPRTLEDVLKYQSLVYMNSGGGGSLQLVTLIGSIISDAVFRTLLSHELLTWPALAVSLENTLHEVRVLGVGKKVASPTIIGIAGLQVPEGQVVDIGRFKLRAPRTIERDLFLRGAGSLTSVVETTTELQVLGIFEHTKENLETDKIWAKLSPRMEAASRNFQKSFDLLRFALLLASPRNEPWVAIESARYVFNSTRPGGSQSWNPSFQSVRSYQLGDDSANVIRNWFTTVRETHVESLDVGMRRLLSAATSRTDAMDAFVDAVIAWENIFGAQTETTYRVTTGIAGLLADSLQDREVLYKELKGLYSARSRLVHGGKEPPVQKIWDYRVRAIEVAADCFRKLYSSRKDLLPLSSEERGARLALE